MIGTDEDLVAEALVAPDQAYAPPHAGTACVLTADDVPHIDPAAAVPARAIGANVRG